MDYFNKKGGVNFKVVAMVMAAISIGVAILILLGVSDVISENADFDCIVGNRLADMAGATSNPCRTRLATIEQIDFNDDLTINNLECPQYGTGGGRDVNNFANRCGTVKLADKGIICWMNYMSGKGDLKTASCYNLCMKPSYGSIEANERGIITPHPNENKGWIIPLEFKGLTGENLLIFEDDGFNAENRQHIGQLIELGNQAYMTSKITPTGFIGPADSIINFVPPTTSKLKTLEIIEIEENGVIFEAIHYERDKSGDVTIVIKIPFQDITVHDLAKVFKNSATTIGGKKGKKYTDIIDKDALRMNTVSYYDKGLFDFDTNAFRPSTDNDELFTLHEDESWIIQYQDSEDWIFIPFTDIEASDAFGYWDTDIDEDSLNYAYNGVC